MTGYSRITTVSLRLILWIVVSLICGLSITTHYTHAFVASGPPGVDVFSLAVQSDGRILVGGYYDSGHRRPSFLVRLNDDGTLDLNYDLENIKPVFLAMQPDGKILVVLRKTRNSFGEVVTAEKIIRLNIDGSIDTSFNAEPDIINIYTIAIQPDGKILIGVRVPASRNTPSKETAPNSAIYRLNTDGRIDKTFSRIVLEGRPSIAIRYVQPDGKILISGNFIDINGKPQANTARLNADGSLDTVFEPHVHYSIFPDNIAIQSNGKILFYGLCPQHDTQTTTPIIRANPDGTCDTSFTPDSDDFGRSIKILPGGKILVGGEYSLSRLDSNGDKDISFKAPYITALDVAVQDDGKILVGGSFRSLTTQKGYRYRNLLGLIRLNADGSVDETFKPWTDNLFKPIASPNSSN